MGTHRSAETKQKLSKTMKERKCSAKENNSHYGKSPKDWMSPETYKKWRANKKNRKRMTDGKVILQIKMQDFDKYLAMGFWFQDKNLHRIIILNEYHNYMNQQELYIDKYCPKNINDYILDLKIKEYFLSMIHNKSLLNFSLVGSPGSGKTTLAKILANEFNASVLFVKCATEGTMDDLRSKVEPFCNALSFNNKQKIVILDELDAASGISGSGSGFQSGLRTLIEAAQSDTKFIITCNYVDKIIPAVLSRCPVIPLKFDKKDLLIHIKKILDAEKVKYTRDSVKAFIEEAFQYYPDVRRIVNYLQFCCSSGELVVNLSKVAESEKNELLDAIVDKLKTSSSMLEVRKFYLAEKDKISDYVEFGSLLYKHVVDHGIVVDLDGILKMTDLLFQLNTVIDKESGFFGLLTAVAKWMEK